MLEIHLFGHFELVRDGQEIAAEVWPQRKTLQLFKLSLREPGKACSQEELATLLWPEVERKRALSSLHSRLSELRRVLEPTSGENGRSSYILRRGRPATYAFSVKSACWLDTLEFARRIRQAEAHLQEGQLARALEVYRAALELYREDFLSEDSLESWSFEPRERYRQQALKAVRSYAACLIKSKRYDQALSVYQRGLRIAPGDEQLYRLLMRVCLLSGGADAALEAYDDCLKNLQSLGRVPSAQIEQLHRQSLAQAASRQITPGAQAANSLESCEAALDAALARYDYDRALVLAERTRRLENLEHFELLIKALSVYEARGQRAKQAECLVELEVLAGRLDDPARVFQVALAQVRYWLVTGATAQAESRLQALLASAQQMQNEAGEGQLLSLLAELRIRQGQYREAYQAARQAELLLRAAGDEPGRARAIHQQACAQMRLKSNAQTLRLYRRAYRLFERHGLKRDLARCSMDMASALAYQGDYAEAIEAYEQTIALLRELRDEAALSAALYNLGAMQWRVGRWGAAARQLSEADELNEKVQNRRGQRMTSQLLGVFALNVGQYRQARAHFERAYKLAKELGARDGEQVYWINRGLVHTELGEYQEALDCQRRAQELAEQNGNRRYVALALLNQGYVLTRLARFDQAFERFEQAEPLVIELKAQDMEIECLMYQAIAYLEQGSSEEALACSSEAVEMLNDGIGYQHPEGVYYYHGQALRRVGRSDEAASFFVQAYDEIKRRARQLEGMELSEDYLNIPFNRKIVETYRGSEEP